MIPLDPVLYYPHTHILRFVAELKEFLAFRSISANPGHLENVKQCAYWLADHLEEIGLEHVRVLPTRGHPVVYADWRQARGRPTLLIYGHYDVQPPDPLHEWHSPPFEPVVKGNDLYGRGASDDKGQMFAHVKALESYLASTGGKLPLNVICLFEGEEEIGSPNLPAFLENHRGALAADVVVLSDMRMLAPNRPVLTTALRGALSVELELTGPAQDLHSGTFGGAVHNPLQALCEIIASLHDSQGRIAIPGFYDRVRRWSQEQRQYLITAGASDDMVLRDAGVGQGWGEPGYSLFERAAIRPALTVNGLSGGYQGPGPKAVIPARASAKLNFRLVPDQEPQAIVELLHRHVSRLTPPTVQAKVHTQLGAKPSLVNLNHPALRAAALAYQKGFGRMPVFLPDGGTIPVVNMFQKVLGLPTVLMGFALPDDRMHAPNEKFHLSNFFNGIVTSIWFVALLGTWKV